ncbi:MAG: hypothetical protein Q4G60_07175 [bacterium]|nr:hypothetical protein [bacterium]
MNLYLGACFSVYSYNEEGVGIDEYTNSYIESVLYQLEVILTSGNYIFRGTLNELNNLQKELEELKQQINYLVETASISIS